MNKLTKVGLSALCGSLAAVSAANAGDMTVTGGVDMTWYSADGNTSTTGNPMGIGSNLTFKGSGELDNGWTFAITVANLNGNAYSNSDVNIDMGGLGKLNINQGNSGNGIDAFDDKMPTAWEEPWGMGLGTGIKLVSGAGPENNVMYTTPTVMGTTITLTVAPDYGSGNTADKGSASASDQAGTGYDGTININPSLGTEFLSGLDVWVGYSTRESFQGEETTEEDVVEATVGGTFSLGPVSVGYARSGHFTGNNTTASDVAGYLNEMYGVSFNINDDLSVSYGTHESTQKFVNRVVDTASDNNTAENADVITDVESFQIAYTMGGASIRYASSEVENAAYQTAAAYDKEARVISVSLAF
tara:strand:- start:273 stop:1349 length:1077 start_codon:yes stop_codon:yes gene_type:complete